MIDGLLRKSVLSVLFFVSLLPEIFAAEPIPVILRVPRAEQHDTLGCNFVEQVCKLSYNLVLSGKIKMWDSPNKDIQITGSTLVEIEKTSKTKFTEPELFFIYENWTKTKEGINTQTVGFMFMNKNPVGEEVSYGFIDFNDIKSSFIQSRIETNADANFDMSFAIYMYKKNFHFNIIQFGGNTITTGGESNDIKMNYIKDLEFNPSVKFPADEERSIVYALENKKTSDDVKTKNSIEILKQVEWYLTSNEELFFNMGGDKITTHIQRGKLRVTKMEVTEVWRKKENEIYNDTKSITFFVNDSALDNVLFDDFIMWGIQVKDKSMYEIFREKDFTYFITKINSQKIARKDSYLYLKALQSFSWRKLTEFVKNY